MSGSSSPELYSQLENKIELGKILVDKIINLVSVRGIDKLKRKIQQEVDFLVKTSNNKCLKKEHLLCSNLHYFEAVVDCLLECSSPTAVLQSFTLTDENCDEYKKVVVDIVCNGGKSWIKVVARNPKALTQLSYGNGQYGKRSVLDKVEEYLQVAKQHVYLFQPPEIIFHFASGVENVLVGQLKIMGITISGFVIDEIDGVIQDLAACSLVPVTDKNVLESGLNTCDPTKDEDGFTDFIRNCKTLNLDVTTLLAFVSSLTNNSSSLAKKLVYKNDLLNSQAESETVKPIKPILEKLFEGKNLICCQSAATSFLSIINQLGGPNEKHRAQDLMAKVKIIPDYESSDLSNRLKCGGKIRPRSLATFLTGHNVQAVTVSANGGFVRAAATQGIDFTVFLHPARALAEKKVVPQ